MTESGNDEDGVDAFRSLQLVLDACGAVDSIDLVVVSGDIADDGSEGGCRAVLQAISAFAATRNIAHVYTTGNHDNRTNFESIFGSGHLSPTGEDSADEVFDGLERAATSHVGGLRVITLDSLIPGSNAGALSAAQLGWLQGILAKPAPSGTLIVVHHPPIYLPDHPMQAAILKDSHDLASVVAGSDVRLILSGHLHLQLSGNLSGVPVWVTPGVVTRIDLTAPKHLVRAVLGGGASIVDIGGPFSPMCHVLQARDSAAGRQVYLYDALSGADVDQ